MRMKNTRIGVKKFVVSSLRSWGVAKLVRPESLTLVHVGSNPTPSSKYVAPYWRTGDVLTERCLRLSRNGCDLLVLNNVIVNFFNLPTETYKMFDMEEKYERIMSWICSTSQLVILYNCKRRPISWGKFRL